jgi:ADP-ribosylglycohydrolase
LEYLPAESDHFNSCLKPGQFTDDTTETLILVESLVLSHGFCVSNFADKLILWGRSWEGDERLARCVGLATRSAVKRLVQGISWMESGAAIPTCGSAMRAGPIGLLYHQNLDLVSKYAQLQSLPTHSSRAALAASSAVATAVAFCLQGFGKEQILLYSALAAQKIDADFAARLRWILSLKNIDVEIAQKLIGNSPLVDQTIPAAFYCFLRFEPVDGLKQAVVGGGDTDSIAAIAGALFGALKGTSWIPEKLLLGLWDKDRITAASESLFTLYESLCP